VNRVGNNESIAESARLGRGVKLGNNVTIMGGCVVGEDCVIGNNVVLREGTRLGSKVTVFDNAVLGRKPQSAGGLKRAIAQDLPGLTIGNGCVVGAGAVLYSGTQIDNNVLIGDLVSIREGCRIGSFVVIGRSTTINYNTSIGEYTKIMDGCHITGDMLIEDHVFISVEVVSTNDNSMGRSEHSLDNRRGPIVRRGAAIGANASLLPGVEIGEYAIVGSGAVVTKNISPRKVAFGVPAREVRDVDASMLP